MRILKIQFAGDTQNKFMFLFREFKEETLRLEVSIPLRLGLKGGGRTKSPQTSQLIDKIGPVGIQWKSLLKGTREVFQILQTLAWT